jgi:transporter family-2 protein
MQLALYLIAAVLLGVLVSIQPLLNGVLGRAVGSPYSAAAISIFVAALGALAMLAVVDRGEISRATLTVVPWWVYLAGVIGTALVAGGVVMAPVTGALVFFVCIVAGQLLGAALADHFGFLGLALRPISPVRVLGLALVIGGAVLVQRG